jgi:hypothetical protein
VSKGLSIPVCRLWAGLDCGLWAASALIGWLALHSALRGDFWWSKFNVAASIFYGDAVFRMGLGRATLAGLALLVVVYACLGMLFGLLAARSGLARNLGLGVLAALAWHILAQLYFWRALSPFAAAYFPAAAMLAGHFLYGLLLSRFASRFQAIAREFGHERPPAPLPAPPPEAEGPTERPAA